jgi:hypothetical protein
MSQGAQKEKARGDTARIAEVTEHAQALLQEIRSSPMITPYLEEHPEVAKHIGNPLTIPDCPIERQAFLVRWLRGGQVILPHG